MYRSVILLFAILLLKITSFSQSTSNKISQDSIVSITSEQLKYTNLIFAEHGKLRVENSLLNKQIIELSNTINIYNEIDSNRIQQIQQYSNLNMAYENNIKDLNRQLKRKKNTILGITIGGVSITAGLLLFILLK